MHNWLTEVAVDESGNELWREPYVFSRLSNPGELFIRNYKSYAVVSMHVEGDIVRTVVAPMGGNPK